MNPIELDTFNLFGHYSRRKEIITYQPDKIELLGSVNYYEFFIAKLFYLLPITLIALAIGAATFHKAFMADDPYFGAIYALSVPVLMLYGVVIALKEVNYQALSAYIRVSSKGISYGEKQTTAKKIASTTLYRLMIVRSFISENKGYNIKILINQLDDVLFDFDLKGRDQAYLDKLFEDVAKLLKMDCLICNNFYGQINTIVYSNKPFEIPMKGGKNIGDCRIYRRQNTLRIKSSVLYSDTPLENKNSLGMDLARRALTAPCSMPSSDMKEIVFELRRDQESKNKYYAVFWVVTPVDMPRIFQYEYQPTVSSVHWNNKEEAIAFLLYYGGVIAEIIGSSIGVKVVYPE